MNNWYKFNIEDPLKDIIKNLRDNGINTFCSCGHKRYIQCETHDIATEIDTIYNVLVEMDIEEYKVNIHVEYSRTYFYHKFLEITFPDENGKYYNISKDNPDYIQYPN